MISVSFSLVRLFSTGPYLRWCQANKFAALFGFPFMSVLWVGLNISDLVLSSFIYFFYLTLTRCLKAGVQGTPTQRSSLTVSLTFFTVKPQSDCQKKQAQSQSSSSLSLRIRCKPDGSYSDVQCDKSTDECWCVNKNGEEVLGTRSLGVVKCSSTGKVLSLTLLGTACMRCILLIFIINRTPDGLY